MNVLRALWAGWKRFAHRLGIINTAILLTVTYVLLAPVAIAIRFFGSDRLRTSHSPGESLWRDPDAPRTDVSPLAAHRRQF